MDPVYEDDAGADRLAQRRAMLAGLGGLAAGAMLTRSAGAGDLNPPAGPVAPTMKNLDIIEPRTPVGPDTTPGDATSVYRITQPGSYYLTGDAAGENGKHAIVIDADDVTIDLMGYALRGVPGSLDGVLTTIARNNLTLRNGVITGFGGSGVDLGTGGSGVGALIERLHVSGNGLYGVFVGYGALVRRCVAANNASLGVLTLDDSVVESCIARENGDFYGIGVGWQSVVRGCVASGNTGRGVSGGAGCTISGCMCAQNTGEGISVSAGSHVVDCVVRQNGGAAGVSAGDGCTIARCEAQSNAGHGVSAFASSTIKGCSASYNGGDGLRVSSGCYVEGNMCRSNSSGAGVHATSRENRIESNNVINNNPGVQVDLSGNLIIRNSARGNTTNYQILVGNSVGPIVTGASIGTDNSPHANYAF